MKLLKMSKEERKEIGGMMWPVFIEQFCIAVMGTFISMIVKGSGLQAVASINLLNSVTMLFQQAYTAIGIGVTVVVAQFRGRGDTKSTGRAASQSTMLAVYMASVVAALCLVFMTPILNVVLQDSEPLIYEYSRIYLTYNVISLPFIGIYTVAAAAIRGSGFPRLSLIATLVHNVAYAVMALLAVQVFNAGILGVSIALLASRVFAAAAGLVLLKRGNKNMQVETLLAFKIEKSILKPMMLVGLPIFLENLLFQVGKVITQTFSVAYGTVGIAVNGIANNMFSMMMVPGTAASNAAPPIVGRYCGMGDKEGARRKGYQFILLAVIFMALASLLMFVLLDPVARFYSDDAYVQTQIKLVVGLCAAVIPILWPLGFVVPAILRSSGDSRYSSVIAVLAMIFMRVGLGYYLTQVLHTGVIGIWIAMYADFVFRAVFFIPRLIKGKWLEKKLIDD